MTPQEAGELAELRHFERKRGRKFTPKQRQEILHSLGIGLGIGLGVNSGMNAGGIAFASLGWTGLEQLFQSDIGLAYDATAVATSGNTSTTAITISTIPTTAPCALLVKATNSATIPAATFSIYADGGTTPFMTGVTPTAGTPIALTGVGTGVSLTWSAGTGVTNDTWKAAAAQWNDQAASPHHGTASGTARPIITPGTGGKLGLLGNGTTTTLATTLALPAAPATTNQYVYLLARMTATPGGNASLCGVPGGSFVGIYCTSAPSIVQYNGSLVNGSTPTINTWYLMAAKFTGSTSDSMQLGSAAAVSGASAGNGTPAGGFYYFSSLGSFFAPCEIMMVAVATSPAPAGFRAAVTSWCGVTQV